MTLLIHSMAEFADDLILPVLAAAGARKLAEIGAEFGGMSAVLADHAEHHGGSLTSNDPAAKPEFAEWLAANPHVTHIAAPSLDTIDELSDVDAWIVDGDHNYYTVRNELDRIAGRSRADSKPLLVLLHDVAWPCARRDCYYAPDRIPEDWRHAHDWDGGVVPGRAPLLAGGGFRGMGQFAWALHEGGPANGVLTAIEDFITAEEAGGASLAFAQIPAVFGLGILFDMTAPWAAEVAALVVPFHDNRLLATLERNRLANYLRVIELQDQLAA